MKTYAEVQAERKAQRVLDAMFIRAGLFRNTCLYDCCAPSLLVLVAIILFVAGALR